MRDRTGLVVRRRMLNEATTDSGASTRAVDPAGARGAEFPCLDGLRAIAAMCVFVAHTSGFFFYHAGVGWAPALLQSSLAPLGGFGVAVFFVLSGFLLYRPFVLAVLP